MSKATRLSKAAKEFNVGISTIVDFLHNKGIDIDSNPNTKISPEIYNILVEEYSSDISVKEKSREISMKALERKETITIEDINKTETVSDDEQDELMIKDLSSNKTVETPKVVGKVDLESPKKTTSKTKSEDKQEEPKKDTTKKETKEENKTQEEETPKGEKLKIIGKIDLEKVKKKSSPDKKVEKTQKENEKKDEVKQNKEEESKKRKEEKKPDIEGKNKPKAKKESDIVENETKEESPIVEIAETNEAQKAEEEIKKEKEPELIYRSEVEKLSGPTVIGKIDLPEKKEKTDKQDKDKKDTNSANDKDRQKRKKRKRIKKKVSPERAQNNTGDNSNKTQGKAGSKKKKHKHEIDEEEVQKQIKETLEKLTSKTKSRTAKYRREKRDADKEKVQAEVEKQEKEKNILKVSEFVSVNELASMMNAQVNEVIATFMNLGMIVSINQRLDAETMSLVAEEFGYKVEFVSAEIIDEINEEEDKEEDLLPRPPIVTVMGHVDHGKTKLLDYIRHTNVVAGEAGGITQHIGAYSVSLDGGKKITFLDTPGHEAFTAMRARGAQITDIAIIVVAADDGVMPQTVEAINHAAAAGVPIIFAINKIDKPNANVEKIKQELANLNFLVEDWGGKYQSQEISAKQGINIDDLLEKVLLEAEMLDLKANPNKKAVGTVLEASLDKGRGYLTNVIVQGGTLNQGDIILAGCHYGHVKAIFNERGMKIQKAGPATPALVLGINGAPQAGDKFNVMDNDADAKSIANKRQQIIREQGQRTQKHITLDEIGRRIAIGNFKELNIIVKGDVDGSVEALSDSLLKLSTDEIQVKIISKAIGQITEADVYLAAASNAIIIGFQVRPSMSARKLAEKEEIDIRLYSIIYDAINEIKDAMEGMLSPEFKEEIVATIEVREIFKISKVGTVAGCMVLDGKIQRNTKIRVIRDGIVIYSGELGSLKRFKDDVKEVSSGYECGLNIDKFNDIKVGDIIEGYEIKTIKKKL